MNCTIKGSSGPVTTRGTFCGAARKLIGRLVPGRLAPSVP